MVIGMADRFAIAVLIRPIKAEFGIGDFQAGLLVGAAFALFYALALLPMGWLADRFSKRRILFFCLAFWTLATMACGLAGSFLALFVCRMLVGSGEAALGPCGQGIIGASFRREELAKPIAFYSIGIQVGAAFGVFVAGAVLTAGANGALSGLPIIGEMAPWRVAFIVLGIPGLLALCLVPLINDPTQKLQSQIKEKLEPIMPFLKEHGAIYVFLFLGTSISAGGFGSLSAWAPEFMIREYGMSPAKAGGAFGSVMLFSALSSQFLYSTSVDAFAKRGMVDSAIRVGLLPLVLSIPAAFFAMTAQSESVFLIGLFVLMFCLMPLSAMGITALHQIAPNKFRARLTSILILLITFMGFAIGPAAVGWFSEFVFGEAKLGLAILTVIVVAEVLAFVFFWKTKPLLAQYLRKE